MAQAVHKRMGAKERLFRPLEPNPLANVIVRVNEHDEINDHANEGINLQRLSRIGIANSNPLVGFGSATSRVKATEREGLVRSHALALIGKDV